MKISKKTLVLMISVIALVAMLAVSFAAGENVSSQISTNEVKVGDTFTMTVSMSKTTVSSLGVNVSVDDAFEIVSGEWLQSGLIASYNAAKQQGAFKPSGTAEMSGDIFKLTLKAKTASASVKNVSITVVAKNSTTTVFEETTTKTVKVGCVNHSFGAYEKTNTEHSRTCSACGYVEKASHSWNDGVVTTPATCTKEGVKTFTCATCNHTKTESIKKLTHTYGTWTKIDETNHSKSCVCGDIITAKHSWDNGKVTTPATCAKDGVKTYTCKDCSATKTDAIGKIEHTYTNTCDDSCNACGATRETSHKYNTKWSSDAKNHWYECSVCKDTKDKAAHTPSDWIIDKEATDLKAGSKHKECTVCKKTVATETIPATGCKHTAGTKLANQKSVTCDVDGYTGDKVCKTCETVIQKGEVIKSTGHEIKLQNAKDATCKEDGYTGDEVCTVCNSTVKPGEVITKGEHTIEITDAKEATCTEDGFTGKHTCTTCGEIIDNGTVVEKLNHKFTDGVCTTCNTKDPDYNPGTTTTTPTEPAPIKDNNDGNIWVFVGIGVGVLVVALVIIFIILKRKHEDDNNR